MTDTFLASSLRTVDADSIDFAAVEIDRGPTLTNDDLNSLTDGYRRFEFTEHRVSPRAFPGHPRIVYASSSDEHDETGHIAEENENRRRMMRKRMGKLQEAEKEMRPAPFYGPPAGG